MMKYVPIFLASGGMLVEYQVIRIKPTPRFPNSFKMSRDFDTIEKSF